MILQLILYSPFEQEKNIALRWGSNIQKFLSSSERDIIALGYFNDPETLGKKLEGFGEKPEALILVIGSGGTERLAQVAMRRFSCPVLLLANDLNNSLAAAIEIHAVMGQTRPVKLIYTPDQDGLLQTEAFTSAVKALKIINQARFGMVGEPSHWLLSSEGIEQFGPFATQLVKIPMEELIEAFEMLEEASGDEVKEAVRERSAKVLISEEAFGEASRVYLAMQQIIGRHRLDGITIKCFDLLDHKFTACLGMGLTNDQGIVASCEGDLHASFSMLIGQLLTGKPVWMANLSSIDTIKNFLTLAHCTVPFSMLEGTGDTTLTTHMESGISVAIEGPMKKETVTIFRTGKDFQTIHALTGSILDTNMGNKALCRTQSIIQSDMPVEAWIQKTPGNHQVLVYGNIIPKLKDFCRFAGIELIL